MFSHTKTINLTPAEERLIILMCEDIKLTDIAKRLGITSRAIYVTLLKIRKKNKIKTNFGVIVRYIGNGYLNKF